MKKLMFAAAVMAVGAAMAVESQVVGYQNVGPDATGWMFNVGVQFSNLSAQDGAFTLDDKFFNGDAVEGDQIITFDGDMWNINQYDKLATGGGWVLTPADGGEPEYLTSISAPKGSILYYAPAVATEVPVAGAVAKLGKQTVTFDMDGGEWIFPLCNPFPIDTTWGDINSFTSEGDQIITFDGNMWNINQYDRLADGFGWVLTPSDGGEPIYLTDDSAVAIPAGGAAYICPNETKSWTVEL